MRPWMLPTLKQIIFLICNYMYMDNPTINLSSHDLVQNGPHVFEVLTNWIYGLYCLDSLLVAKKKASTKNIYKSIWCFFFAWNLWCGRVIICVLRTKANRAGCSRNMGGKGAWITNCRELLFTKCVGEVVCLVLL